jgi:polyphosphate kinase
MDQVMMANLKDEAQSWVMGPDGEFVRVKVGSAAFSAQHFFMTNPSLSGRGSALRRDRGRGVGKGRAARGRRAG